LKPKLIYQKLYTAFGPQHWWPGETPFEVMVGAILTQNTNWQNVEIAIKNLKKAGALTPDKLYKINHKKLAALIRPAGYFNIKAKRLKNFLEFLHGAYNNNIKRMASCDVKLLRGQLLSVNGIGPETADSILLYALNKPVFVVDAYTRRIFLRHKLIKKDFTYDQVREFFMDSLPREKKLFNEFHALIVKLGKDFCLKRKPRCEICPLG